MSSKRPKIYFIANNGIKIEMNTLNAASIYAREQVRNELVKAFQIPKDILFPAQITVQEPRLNVALTDELRSKGSVEVTFKYDEVNKCSDAKEKNHMM